MKGNVRWKKWAQKIWDVRRHIKSQREIRHQKIREDGTIRWNKLRRNEEIRWDSRRRRKEKKNKMRHNMRLNDETREYETTNETWWDKWDEVNEGETLRSDKRIRDHEMRHEKRLDRRNTWIKSNPTNPLTQTEFNKTKQGRSEKIYKTTSEIRKRH